MGRLSWLLVPVLLTSCAYLPGWNSHKFLITTANGKPAYCAVKNKIGEWRGYTGTPIKISSAQGGDLRVSCAMNGLRGGKIIRVAGGKSYPDNVMVTMHVRKKTNESTADNPPLPKDNDEAAGDFSGDDFQDTRPLNALPETSDDDVVIIKH